MGGKHGALRFSLCPAYFPGLKKDEGVIFLEAAPTIGKNSYDWENQKVTIALGLTDISKIVLYLKTWPTHLDDNGNSCVNIYHDSSSSKNLPPNTNTSTVKVSRSLDPNSKSFFWKIAKKTQAGTTEINLPVSNEETIIISKLLDRSIPAILGW